MKINTLSDPQSTHWEYIGGHQWSLVESINPLYDTYDNHICSIEIERGKLPIVAYLERKLTREELEQILAIVTVENS